jgi:MoaA/NifB/PqqE/SkfB family radical SAM enzyme
MNVSLNPTYLCNLRCPFCYLGDKLSDPKTTDLKDIDLRLKQISQYEKIEHIDLYGGEIQLLSKEYLDELFLIIKKYYGGKINIITNLTKITDVLMREDVDVSVSFDFECRSGFKNTLSNMLSLNKHIAVLMLASPCLINIDVDYMIQTLNSISNVKSVEIKPYSTNQYNSLNVTFKDFEEFIKKFLNNKVQLKSVFVNEFNIVESIKKERNAFSDNHVYITPSGKFGILDFDSDDREHFVEMENIEEYFTWRENEKIKVKQNKICSKCDYFGTCLTEHYRDVKSLENSCNGFKFLLEWYERTQITTESLSSNPAHNRLNL